MRWGNNSDRDWGKLSEKDRYYWVTTFNKYRDSNLSDELRDEFFDEASDYLNKLLSIIRQHVNPDFEVTRALDFGCGAGRVAVPLARIASEVTGLDIAPGMLEEAEKNAGENGLSNLNLALSDDSLSGAKGTFDFIHSIYVFQHIPLSRGLAIVQRMLDRLDEGGVLSLQFLISNDLSRIRRIRYWMRVHLPLVQNLWNLLKRQGWSAPIMQLNSYPLNSVIDLLNEGGCSQFYLRHTKDGPYNGVILIAQKKPVPAQNVVDLGKIP